MLLMAIVLVAAVLVMTGRARASGGTDQPSEPIQPVVVLTGSYACTGGVENSIPVDLRIKGCPPSPMRILEGLLALLAVSGQ